MPFTYYLTPPKQTQGGSMIRHENKMCKVCRNAKICKQRIAVQMYIQIKWTKKGHKVFIHKFWTKVENTQSIYGLNNIAQYYFPPYPKPNKICKLYANQLSSHVTTKSIFPSFHVKQ